MSTAEQQGDFSPADCDKEFWDCLVIGAGPAGAVAAALLAGRGWHVLLVERAHWPREKACGGCLNAAAVGLLEHLGLGGVIGKCGGNGRAITRFELRLGRRRLEIPLPAGVAIARQEFDARLVDEAIARGCRFAPETSARILPQESEQFRSVRLNCGGEPRDVRAKIVLACDGLGGNSLAGEPWAKVHRDRLVRLGFSATANESRVAALIPGGVIAMHVGDGGYVGVVRLGGDRVHIGAAISPKMCNQKHGPAAVIREILSASEFSLPVTALPAEFAGTGPLCVRRPCVAGPRVLAVGDACGYAEPFTGEGISWAIRGAIEAAAILPEQPDQWDGRSCGRWQERYECEIRARQCWCRRLRMLIHRPALGGACMRFAAHFPGAAAQLAQRISA